MKKRFNVTGNCLPGQHYMADTSAKFAKILDMVDEGLYFTINRPRQYGKTTTLFALEDAIKQKEGYVVFRISFEGVGDAAFESESALAPMFFRQLARSVQYRVKELAEYTQAASLRLNDMETLSHAITELVVHCGKKVVVLIDEVDKSSNNQLFLNFLGMLRDKYLERTDIPTFHSVVLVGVHDVKSLKLKIRPEAEKKLNSPWNIAADFKVDMNLQPAEIRPMLEEYARDREVALDAVALSERLFYYTSGYPFLVSKLCKMFDEEMLPEKAERTWTPHDVDLAARQLLTETNVNFDDLIKNLRNNPDLYDLVEKLLIEGQDFSFDAHSDRINLGLTYGVFAQKNNRLAIHNRIYRELILNYMSANAEHTSRIAGRDSPDGFLLPGRRFDVKRALRQFQEWMKVDGSDKQRDFLEHQGRLVFLAYLRPILNGHGHALKEPQVSDERRLDILITYYEHRYVIELKVWRGPAAHKKGLDQLAAYLDALGLEEGGLLIFDHSKQKHGTEDEVVHQGKRIFMVWV